ncbi:hypothetical protein PPERSA_07623 [Pseudocohnilembus persalinus]|uniref:Uncharacterized protein n=1 Tax=Pseudocohnilembus persalinus TaxID=266149 RepID=A0A0V0QIP8_PSEPJ|nr:hypothetical protein PPERSA_07623 [Pseudocohnilembus persalinus]|eukprot:KRX01978.1 hypothetical protein PPERSA_07623 [Pseudocohnilembus persalinus]
MFNNNTGGGIFNNTQNQNQTGGGIFNNQNNNNNLNQNQNMFNNQGGMGMNQNQQNQNQNQNMNIFNKMVPGQQQNMYNNNINNNQGGIFQQGQQQQGGLFGGIGIQNNNNMQNAQDLSQKHADHSLAYFKIASDGLHKQIQDIFGQQSYVPSKNRFSLRKGASYQTLYQVSATNNLGNKKLNQIIKSAKDGNGADSQINQYKRVLALIQKENLSIESMQQNIRENGQERVRLVDQACREIRHYKQIYVMYQDNFNKIGLLQKDHRINILAMKDSIQRLPNPFIVKIFNDQFHNRIRFMENQLEEIFLLIDSELNSRKENNSNLVEEEGDDIQNLEDEISGQDMIRCIQQLLDYLKILSGNSLDLHNKIEAKTDQLGIFRTIHTNNSRNMLLKNQKVSQELFSLFKECELTINHLRQQIQRHKMNLNTNIKDVRKIGL